jgi:hypothetical protein
VTGSAWRARPLPSRAGDVATSTVVCAALGLVVAVLAAAAIVLAGLADDARAVLGLRFGELARSPSAALAIALQNVKLAAGTLACAAAAPRLPPGVRVLVGLWLAALLVLNAGLVGVAFGAYGTRLVGATALHLSVEFAALSLAGGAYLAAVREPLGARQLAAVGLACLLLLVVAAVLETYAQVG